MQMLLSFIHDRCGCGHSRSCAITEILWRCSPPPKKKEREREDYIIQVCFHPRVGKVSIYTEVISRALLFTDILIIVFFMIVETNTALSRLYIRL